MENKEIKEEPVTPAVEVKLVKRMKPKDKVEVITMRKMGLSREIIEKKTGKMSDDLWNGTWKNRRQIVYKYEQQKVNAMVRKVTKKLNQKKKPKSKEKKPKNSSNSPKQTIKVEFITE